MRVDRHKDTIIVRGERAAKLINSRRFHSMNQIGDDVYEIKMQKKTVKWALPLHLGYCIYQYAKLELLRIVYSFLQKFIHPRDYQISNTDTDSMYFACSKKTLNEMIEPQMRDVFQREKGKWFPRNKCQLHDTKEFDVNDDCLKPPNPEQKCCYDVYMYDKREPGLWKLESQSDSICALSPKCYITVNHNEDEDQTVKLSSKGVAHSNDLSWSNYTGVFSTGVPYDVVNRGIQQAQLYSLNTYTLRKVGLSYLYIKRKVKPGGSETEPLDL